MSNPKARILDTAARLFETQGFPNTGINQIVEESKTARASFYDSFPSKESLGRAYLDSYGEKHMALLEHLMEKNPTPMDFAEAWVRILKRRLRSGLLFGCPMANMAAQVSNTAPAISGDLTKIAKQTIVLLTNYLARCENEGTIPKNPGASIAARRLFVCYEGAIHVWRLTGMVSALDDFIPLARSAIGLK